MLKTFIIIIKVVLLNFQRVIQYLASRTTNWSSLANFMDKSGVQGNVSFQLLTTPCDRAA